MRCRIKPNDVKTKARGNGMRADFTFLELAERKFKLGHRVSRADLPELAAGAAGLAGRVLLCQRRAEARERTTLEESTEGGMGLLILASLVDVKAARVPAGHQILLRRAL